MENETIVTFLRNTNLVSPHIAIDIAGHFTNKNLNKKGFLLKEGSVCKEYYFLNKGFIRSFAHDTEGNEVTTNFYAKNNFVFEVSSFFGHTKSKENIQALSYCEGCFITYDQLNSLFHSLEEFREFGRYILVKGFSSTKARMLSMITESAEDRYINLLKTAPEIFENASLKHIASYLGITDTSLSRIRKTFSRK